MLTMRQASIPSRRKRINVAIISKYTFSSTNQSNSIWGFHPIFNSNLTTQILACPNIYCQGEGLLLTSSVFQMVTQILAEEALSIKTSRPLTCSFTFSEAFSGEQPSCPNTCNCVPGVSPF